MSWITTVVASLTLAIAACTPPLASSATAPPASAKAIPSVSPLSVATAAPAVQPASSPSPVAAPDVKIVEPAFRPPQEWTYTPRELSVKVGTTVIWTNTGAVAHTVTADDAKSFDSGTVDPKGTFTLALNAAGTFAYHCTFHAWMKATLVVTR